MNPATADPPRSMIRRLLWVTWFLGRLVATLTALLMASMTVALEISYRVMVAFTDWRPFVLSKEVTIALFLVLFVAIFGLLEWAIFHYLRHLGEQMAARIRLHRRDGPPGFDVKSDPDRPFPRTEDPRP